MNGRILRTHLRKAVLVELKSGQTFRGVLFDADRDCFILRNAQVIDGQQSVPVDGEVLILRPDVAFVQYP